MLIIKHIWVALALLITPTQSDTTTFRIPPALKCPAWTQKIIETGWTTLPDITTVDYIIWRESRCFANSFNAKDPWGGSWGLMQINSYWCKPSKWHANGYLQSFNILKKCDQLLNPQINLLAAKLIYNYSLIVNNNGWQPWGL